MLKTKIFHFLAEQGEGEAGKREFTKKRDAHDKEIIEFIEGISKDGNAFINMNSIAYGRYEPTNRIRTIIVYFENPARKVITEKHRQS